MKLRALKAAFPNTIPIMAGFFFIGITYGIYMRASGFPIIYPTIMSIIIFGGSLEFVAVEMLLSPFAPVSVFMMALLIQARHLFYGLSMLEKYKNTGFKKLYLVYGLCDESFSINYTANIPEGVDKSWFYFFVTMLNQSYWVIGATTGALIGSLFKFEIKGISFVMTAMFVVIFLDQWMKEKIHISAFIGIGASLVCLLIFGPNSFMLPTMIVILSILAIFKKPFSRLEVEK
ncbi:MAG: AzlC family ABC transporter permease [Lachnospiraceae bacterium]|nr:AzlC family ABC transporter permease [Lachnospiraceae bacterium]